MSKLFVVGSETEAAAAVTAAADALRAGELVVFPTETVYGLAADALNADAVARVFAAKRRKPDHPLPVQIPAVESLGLVSDAPDEAALVLARTFWPGPLTLIVPKGQGIPEIVTAGRDTIGVRAPDHPIALALLKEFGGPIVATSANVSGNPAPVTAREAMEQMGDAVQVVIDAGSCSIGVASTVVDTTCDPPEILREGSISKREIMEALTGTRGE